MATADICSFYNVERLTMMQRSAYPFYDAH